MSASLPDFGPLGLVKASSQIRELLIETLRDQRGVHLETAVTGIAAVAGTLLLRSTGIPLDNLPVGSPLFSPAVDEVGPRYVEVLSAMCEGAGIDPVGGWSDPVPENHKPLASIPDLTRKLEAPFQDLCNRLSIPSTSRPEAALFTAVRLLAEGKEMLPASAGKALILSGLVAGGKTVPTPLGKSSDPVNPLWKRLFSK